MKNLQQKIRTGITSAILACTLTSGPAVANDEEVTFTLATSPVSLPEFRTDGKNVLTERPGYRAELLYQAGKLCHVNVQFKLMPWKRALHLLEYGGADAAFRSSYKKERTRYGAYPMKNGAVDPSRAISGYTYSLLTRKDSDLSWNGVDIKGSSKRVVVERGSVGIDLARTLGMEFVEVNDIEQMIQMLAAKRVDGAVGITNNLKVLARAPQLANQIVFQQPPLKSKQGYLMFSKRTYNKQTEKVECFWDAIRTIRATPEYLKMVESYKDESAE